MDYSSYCGYCNETRTDINNYFCLKNRGACENCYKKVKARKKKQAKNLIGFAYWSNLRRPDEPVDKKRIKNA